MKAIDDAQIDGWRENLRADHERLSHLQDGRGLRGDTIAVAEIGWDGHAYSLPVRDEEGRVANVRRCLPGAEHKVIHTKGCGSPVRWYWPWASDDEAPVVVAEGEMDCLLTGQAFGAAGIEACVVTGTGGAGSVPCPADLERLRDRQVFVAYDCDEAGRAGATKLARSLHGLAGSVVVVDLGLEDGQDLSDWFRVVGRSAEDLWALMQGTAEWSPATGAPRRDSGELLAIAVATKVDEEGSRNAAGFWLACQLAR